MVPCVWPCSREDDHADIGSGDLLGKEMTLGGSGEDDAEDGLVLSFGLSLELEDGGDLVLGRDGDSKVRFIAVRKRIGVVQHT